MAADIHDDDLVMTGEDFGDSRHPPIELTAGKEPVNQHHRCARTLDGIINRDSGRIEGFTLRVAGGGVRTRREQNRQSEAGQFSEE